MKARLHGAHKLDTRMTTSGRAARERISTGTGGASRSGPCVHASVERVEDLAHQVHVRGEHGGHELTGPVVL